MSDLAGRNKTGATPGVSVVVAAYNAEAFIEQAVRSVLQQTYSDLELIVIDDGSTDATADVVAGFGDPRIRLLQGDNGGPARARNRGIDAARAPWIAILDADDYWLEHRLATLLPIAEDEQVDLVADDLMILVDEEQQGTFFEEVRLQLAGPVELQARDFIERRLAGKPTPRPGILKPVLRRSFLLDAGVRYAEDVHGPEDWLFYAQCLLREARFAVVPHAMYCYRRVPDSLSLRDPIAMLEEERRAVGRLSTDARLPAELQPGLSGWLEEIEERIAFHRLRAALRTGHLRSALRIARSVPASVSLYMRHVVTQARVKAAVGARLAKTVGVVRRLVERRADAR